MMKVIQKIQKHEDTARRNYDRANLYLQKYREAKAKANSNVFKAQRLREQVTA